MPEHPEQRYKLESYINSDDSARDTLAREAFPVAKEARGYLDQSRGVREYVDAAQRSNDAEDFINVLGLVTMVTGMAYRAGVRSSGYGLAAAAVLGVAAMITKAEASSDMETAAKQLTAPKYAGLLEAGSKSNNGYHIELLAASLAWGASLPMASLAFGKVGRGVDLMVTSLGLGAAGFRNLRSTDTGITPLRTAVEDLARSEKHQSQ